VAVPSHLLKALGIPEPQRNSVLARLWAQPRVANAWVMALDRATRLAERDRDLGWAVKRLVRAGEVPHPASDLVADIAEADAFLRLAWLGIVEPIPRSERPTPDFRIGQLNVEVCCPLEHQEERKVMEASLQMDLVGQDGPVRVAIATGYPTTGSGRSTTHAGEIERDLESKALEYPANKIIDRILSSKWSAHQFRDGSKTLLWLDLKHGMQFQCRDLLPLSSLMAKGHCLLGTPGIWHAFYGEVGAPLVAERSDRAFTVETYEQRRRGWFREHRNPTGALVAVVDGVVLLENPWSENPLSDDDRQLISGLSELRPEYCWFGAGELGARVAEVLAVLHAFVGPPKDAANV